MTCPILIYGPTASGKSALALALARHIDAVIVNADALQVYADLRVLTARPDDTDLASVPHLLYGEVDAAERFSVGKWVRRAGGLLQAAQNTGKTPIVVGGTGLAFLALTDGLANIPEIPPQIRLAVTEDVARDPVAALEALALLDPTTAKRLFPADSVRLIRALEVYHATGRSLSAWHAETTPLLSPGSWVGVALKPPRPSLYEAIEHRLDTMLAAGALEEAQALWARGLPRDLPAMKAHGMPWLAQFFDGAIPIETAAALAKRDTRHYAKRQYTWLNARPDTWHVLEETSVEKRVAQVLALIGRLDACP